MKQREQTWWYRRRSYPHFDLPQSYENALLYVSDPKKIQMHNFMPFLSFEKKLRRFGKDRPKVRPIKYASHKDSYIYSYYSNILSEKYEQLLEGNGLSDVVLAYRSNKGNNITFAKEAFDHIERLADCVAIGFDIANFFDKIDHACLKARWKELIELPALPHDHYAVFRSITRYSYVDREQCYERLECNQSQKKFRRPICDINIFRKLIKARDSEQESLIQKNIQPYGIPQGSPISAILANLYLFPFDKVMLHLAQEIGGIYRRYSDDILWIVPINYESQVKSLVQSEIAKLQLEIQENKTLTSHFFRNLDGTISLQDGNKPFQYLGFTFDGKTRLIRPQTLSRYWRKTISAVKKAKFDAEAAGRRGRSNKVFKRKLYRRFSHLGHNNFITYAKRAAQVMSDENIPWKNSRAWRQIKKHPIKLGRLLNTA